MVATLVNCGTAAYHSYLVYGMEDILYRLILRNFKYLREDGAVTQPTSCE